MCGIIAVLRRQSRRQPPAPDLLQKTLTEAEQRLAAGRDAKDLDAAAEALRRLDQELRGVPGLWTLLQHGDLVAQLRPRLAAMQAELTTFERSLDQQGVSETPDATIELRNAALVRIKDALWAVLQDRLPHAEAVRDLAGGTVPHLAAAAAWASVQGALSALDRLEVRGRDSAGVTVIVSGIDTDDKALRALFAGRDQDPLFQNGSARLADGCLDLVYKHSAEIGELGDNVRTLRDSMRADQLLHAALQAKTCEALVLGHTRWASVGIISEPNAHPLNHEETGNAAGPYVLGVLNGDVDNHQELVARHGLSLHDAITTDAKVIPALVSRQMQDGQPFAEAFRRTVASFEGSVAIGAATTRNPDHLAPSLRGSGQALYIGTGEDTFVVASEPYGVIEECDRYLRMDGETPGNPANPTASRGQVVVLDRSQAGEIGGIQRLAFDGTTLPVTDKSLTTAAVTTRDIDRGTFRHSTEDKKHIDLSLRNSIQCGCSSGRSWPSTSPLGLPSANASSIAPRMRRSGSASWSIASAQR